MNKKFLKNCASYKEYQHFLGMDEYFEDFEIEVIDEIFLTSGEFDDFISNLRRNYDFLAKYKSLSYCDNIAKCIRVFSSSNSECFVFLNGSSYAKYISF